jgi:hypothetical protein
MFRRFFTVASNVRVFSRDILLGPHLKADRANQHLQQLIAWTEPLSPDLFSLVIEPNLVPPHVNPQGERIRYQPVNHIEKRIACVIGDVVHNFRAALDHLASAIVTPPGKKIKDIYFPMSLDRDRAIDSGGLAQMEAALPGSKEIFATDVRPPNSGDDRYWGALQSMDIDEKHNLIIPTVAITHIDGVNCQLGGGNRVTNFTVIPFDAGKPYVFGVADKITLDSDPRVRAQITFGKGTPLAGEAVIPTLLKFGQIVQQTFRAFDKAICNSWVGRG